MTIPTQSRPLSEIAAEIEHDWPVINNEAARKALGYMKTIHLASDPFGADPTGYGVIGSFIDNSRGWRGDVAHRLKKELREICRHSRP